LRVIAGVARRTALVAPVGLSTRPTSDRAKENLFNILGEKVKGARVLDVFCGSGAIGIEALSRGASEAVFVDHAAPAIRATETNLTKTRLASLAYIIQGDAQKSLEQLAAAPKFNLIFLDPPYNYDLQILAKCFPLLANDGIIVAEAASDYAAPFAELVTSERIYGRTKFIFYKERDNALNLSRQL